MKKFILLGVLIALLGCADDHEYYPPPPVEEPTVEVGPVTFGTVGEGATATCVEQLVELYTEDGGVGSAYVRLTLEDPIPLNKIASLSYEAMLVSFYGRSTPVLEVVFNIDADDDGVLEGTGLAWMTPATSHEPSALGDDNFLSGDMWPFAVDSDPGLVVYDALSDGYYYWCANDTRDGFGGFWTQFFAVMEEELPANDIDETDKVYSIDFICGTSGNWVETKVVVRSLELNGIEYEMPL